MSIETKKKICAALAGAFASEFVYALWYLPDVRMYEGLDWRIEFAIYALTLLSAIFFAWLAKD